MSWAILFVAGLLEIVWAIGLKYTDGFTKLMPTLGTIAALITSFILLGVAMKSLPVGTAYAVWVGIGSVGTAILGMILFDESTDTIKIASLALICIGLAGLKLAHS